MIIRRRHTANYTTISNTLFRDKRLAADEVGILGFLLSQPDDWEVRRPALARRWKYGREAIRRVIFNLVKSGWCVPHRTRLANGTFHIVYEIRDEPGPELTDDEARRDLSLVSSGSASAASEEESAADDPETHPPSTGDPHTGHPSTGDPTTAGRMAPIEDSLTTESQSIDSTKEKLVFGDLQRSWKADHILSPVACEKQYLLLNQSDRNAAHNGALPYLADCRAKNRKVCDLATYLRERRFERFQQEASSDYYDIKPGTAEGFRWREHRISDGSWSSFMESQWKAGKSHTEATKWPPGQATAKGGRMGEGHGNHPPESANLMTSDDEQELARG